MTTGQILLAIITGLIVNECCDVSPWLAHKLVRWSAHRRYVPPARAEVRAEELVAYIDDRPGRLFKLITALGFATAAVVTRKVAPGVTPPIPLWSPTTPTVLARYEYGERTGRGHPKFRAMCQAWSQLTDEVRNAAKEVGVASCSWRRCIKELRRITRDDRWTLVERNIDCLEKISNPPPKGTRQEILRLAVSSHVRVIPYWFPPTDSTITSYQAAVETARAEIRRLVSDFLLSSAPH